MVVMEGRVWHRTGFNRTASSHRAGIFAFYTLPIYMPQENWFLRSIPRSRHYASETLLQLSASAPPGSAGSTAPRRNEPPGTRAAGTVRPVLCARSPLRRTWS